MLVVVFLANIQFSFFCIYLHITDLWAYSCKRGSIGLADIITIELGVDYRGKINELASGQQRITRALQTSVCVKGSQLTGSPQMPLISAVSWQQ